MAKKSFIPTSLFFSVIVIVILTSLVVRWILPDDEDPTQSHSQSDYYLNFFRNLELPEELQADVEEMTEEEGDEEVTGNLLSVSALGVEMVFASNSQDFTSAFPSEILVSGDEWLPSALAVTPHVMVGDAGLAYTSEIMGADENVIATVLMYFDFTEKQTRELTRIEHEAHMSENSDTIRYLAYDHSTGEILILVERDYDLLNGNGGDYRQEVYVYSLASDSRSLLDVDLGTSPVAAVYSVSGTRVFEYGDFTTPIEDTNVSSTIGVLTKDGVREFVLEGYLSFFQEYGGGLYFGEFLGNDIVVIYPETLEQKRFDNTLDHSTWYEPPILAGTDPVMFYYLGSEKDKSEQLFSSIPGGDPQLVYEGFGRPKVMLSDTHLVIAREDDTAEVTDVMPYEFAILDLEDNILTPFNNPANSYFVGVRKP